MLLLKLYIAFFKIGAFGFGGGYAMLPLIEREIVTTHQWISYREFIDIIGISQMTPGPVAINAATFVGYKMAGIPGSISATLGVVTLSFVLVSIASHYVIKFKESKFMKLVLLGMKPALAGLVISAFLSLARESYIDARSVIIGLMVMAMLFSKRIHPILVIAVSGLLGVLFYSF
ncbi:MAG: chromate transporter protein [Firmicutes bacterium]|nr:chromate transporter protein [Bacillota bacterium]